MHRKPLKSELRKIEAEDAENIRSAKAQARAVWIREATLRIAVADISRSRIDASVEYTCDPVQCARLALAIWDATEPKEE